MTTIFSLLVFVLSGLCEIGGGYLIWLWLREGKNIWLALIGTILLTTYGFVATLQQQILDETMLLMVGSLSCCQSCGDSESIRLLLIA